MKCSLCGTELLPGNNTCPKCGSLNMSFESFTPQTNVNNQSVETPQVVETPTPVEVATPEVPTEEVIEEFVDLDEGPSEEVHASEDMAVPTLEVEQENLTVGAKDITSSQDVSTYDPTQEVKEEVVQEQPKETGINFNLPEVKEAEADTQGMGIMEIKTNTQTVSGDNNKSEELTKKEKFSLTMFKRKTLPRNLVIILLTIVLVIGILIGSTVFSKQVYTPTSTKSKNTTEKVKHVADGKNNTTYVGNYLYKIPEEYDYDKLNGGLVVYGNNDEFRLFIKAKQGSYEYIANSKESIRKSMDNIGMSVNNIKETALNEKPYVVVEATVGPRNRIYAMCDGNHDNIFYIEIISSDNDYNYIALDIANDIINNAEYNDKYSNMENAQYEDASDIIVTAAEAHQNA
jgi:hypothetical protein